MKLTKEEIEEIKKLNKMKQNKVTSNELVTKSKYHG